MEIITTPYTDHRVNLDAVKEHWEKSKKKILKEYKQKVKETIDKWVCISEDAKPTAQEVAYGIKKELGLE